MPLSEGLTFRSNRRRFELAVLNGFDGSHSGKMNGKCGIGRLLPVGFDEILEADVGQVELDAKLALEFGAGESDFGTGAKTQRFASLLRFGFQISEKRNRPEPD